MIKVNTFKRRANFGDDKRKSIDFINGEFEDVLNSLSKSIMLISVMPQYSFDNETVVGYLTIIYSE